MIGKNVHKMKSYFFHESIKNCKIICLSTIAIFLSFLKRCITFLYLYQEMNQSNFSTVSQKLSFCNSKVCFMKHLKKLGCFNFLLSLQRCDFLRFLMLRSESKICMSKLHQRALAVGGICWTYTKDRWLKQKCTFIEGRRHMWTVIVCSRLGHRNFLSWKKGHKGPIGQRHFKDPLTEKKPLFWKTVKNLPWKINS